MGWASTGGGPVEYDPRALCPGCNAIITPGAVAAARRAGWPVHAANCPSQDSGDGAA